MIRWIFDGVFEWFWNNDVRMELYKKIGKNSCVCSLTPLKALQALGPQVTVGQARPICSMYGIFTCICGSHRDVRPKFLAGPAYILDTEPSSIAGGVFFFFFRKSEAGDGSRLAQQYHILGIYSLVSSNMTVENPWTEWRFSIGTSPINGPFSSTPCLTTRGYTIFPELLGDS